MSSRSSSQSSLSSDDSESPEDQIDVSRGFSTNCINNESLIGNQNFPEVSQPNSLFSNILAISRPGVIKPRKRLEPFDPALGSSRKRRIKHISGRSNKSGTSKKKRIDSGASPVLANGGSSDCCPVSTGLAGFEPDRFLASVFLSGAPVDLINAHVEEPIDPQRSTLRLLTPSELAVPVVTSSGTRLPTPLQHCAAIVRELSSDRHRVFFDQHFHLIRRYLYFLIIRRFLYFIFLYYKNS